MKKTLPALALFLVIAGSFSSATPSSAAAVPDNLVVEGVPAHTPELRADVGRYLEFRAAGFASWHPQRREMLIATRFADTPQLHLVKFPGGARQQITFFTEPVAGGRFQPKEGKYLVFSQDRGGSEFYQLYRFDLDDARVTLLTDGKSRNGGAHFSHDGNRIAYTSTRRNGKDADIYVMNPADPKSARLLAEIKTPGWSLLDWSPDDASLLVLEYISINESYLHLVDTKTGAVRALTPRGGEKVSYGGGQFAQDGKSLFVTSDRGSEFQRLARVELASGKETPVTTNIPWDIEEFELSPDGKLLAFVANEDGVSRLHLMDARGGKEQRAPQLPLGVISSVKFHENSRDLAFTMSSARSPSDAYSVDVKTGAVERWTESETGGLNTATFSEPELVKLKSFDGLEISAFVYRPDAKKFPGPRPSLVIIHGGPESQSRPSFLARNNYLLNELGIALVVPNVRGSAGRGKTFLTLDNGFKREDSVKDIGAIIDWIKRDASLDGGRIAVYGGSYGGYIVLASLTHFSDRLRCGVDVVGISHFVTFLNNTQDYRRDLRRAEYGDERDPAMRAHLEKISPLNSVKKITKPLFVVQGANDPRVPLTEAEQMRDAIRKNGGTAWYLMAKDEGHGFGKKKNADFQFLSMVLFLREHLVK
ncbi:MAG: alpha/beta fold hydrolase [Verrucomicrobia bacterium]|nr:alpha/beta fold hydrolase [Verrucomicrobiota bacterium]